MGVLQLGVAVRDRAAIWGELRIWDRPAGARVWRPVLRRRNIVLNGFYNDLFALLTAGTQPAGGLQIVALALGVGNTAPARTDTGLALEWTANGIDTTSALLSGTTTSVPLDFPLPVALSSGNTFTIAGQTFTVAAAGAAIGATSIPVNSLTVSPNIAAHSLVVFNTGFTPQRMSPVATSQVTTDPPNATWNFYLPAGANSVSFTFAEAGLLYNAPSLVAGGAGSWATHVAFSYNKSPNTDTQLSYTLQRSAT